MFWKQNRVVNIFDEISGLVDVPKFVTATQPGKNSQAVKTVGMLNTNHHNSVSNL